MVLRGTVGPPLAGCNDRPPPLPVLLPPRAPAEAALDPGTTDPAVVSPSELASSPPSASLGELRICSAWPSIVAPPPKPPNAWSARFCAANLGLLCGRAGWFDPPVATSTPPLPVDVTAVEPPAADPPPVPAAVAPATAPSTAAAPAVMAVTAAPINAPAVDPTSPLTILLAIQ